MATNIGGDKFINCILIGLGGILGGIISGFALGHVNDKVVFLVCSFLTMASNFVFLALPAGMPQYICFLMFVVFIAG